MVLLSSTLLDSSSYVEGTSLALMRIFAHVSKVKTFFFVVVHAQRTAQLKASMLLPNMEFKDKKTLLFTVAQDGNEEAVDMLLKCGANVNAVNKDGSTPLHAACRSDSILAVNYLIEAGAKVNAVDKNKSSPLHVACNFAINGPPPIRLFIIRSLIKAGANINAQTEVGLTPLGLAVMRLQDAEIIKELLKCGANVNATDNVGWTALHGASGLGLSYIIDILLAAGANINAVARDGSTALHIAFGDYRDEALKRLYEAGADLEGRNKDGYTMLQLAVWYGRIDLVQLFLAEGNRKVTDSKGGSLLHLAADDRGNGSGMMEFLLLTDLDVNSRDNNGNTPLHEASLHGSTATVDVLLRANADHSAVNNDGDTPLLLASKGQCLNPVLVLLLHGANVNVTDRKGLTPLHHAVNQGFTEMVWALSQAGADLNIRPKVDIEGEGRPTPVEAALARSFDHKPISVFFTKAQYMNALLFADKKDA